MAVRQSGCDSRGEPDHDSFPGRPSSATDDLSLRDDELLSQQRVL
jgi:hypothetical protein